MPMEANLERSEFRRLQRHSVMQFLARVLIRHNFVTRYLFQNELIDESTRSFRVF